MTLTAFAVSCTTTFYFVSCSVQSILSFLFLTRYVPNVAKEEYMRSV